MAVVEEREGGARFKSVTLTAGQLQDRQSPLWPPQFVGRPALRLEALRDKYHNTRTIEKLERAR